MKSFAPTTGLILTIAGPAIDHSVTNFGKILRVAAGAKINSRRCENIGGSAIFGVPRQGHLNNGPICAPPSCVKFVIFMK